MPAPSRFWLAGTAFLSAPLHAQDIAEPAEIIVTAERENRTEVRRSGQVGALGDKAAEDVPFSIRSYTGAIVLNQQPQTLGQVLENDPSVRTSYGFGNAAEQFVIRGFTLFGDDVGLDGLYGIAPRQLVAPELFDSIQLLGGATAFLNGAAPGGSGIGGSINLVPKRAAGRDLTRATLGYVSGAHWGGSADVSRRMGGGRFGVRVNGALRQGEVAIDDEDRKAVLLGGAFDVRGDRLRASLDIAYQRVRVDRLRPKVTVTDFVPRVPDGSSNYAQPWTFTDLEDVFGVARVEYDAAENVLIFAQAGAREGSEDGIYGSITALDPDGSASGGALFVPRTDSNRALQAGVRARAATGPVSHELNAGISHSRQVNRNAFDFLGGFAPYATDLYDTPRVPLPGSGFVGGDLDDPYPIARTRLTSVYASDTLGLWDERLLLTAGLRHQRIATVGYGYYDGGAEASRYDESAVTPVAGIVFKPRSGLSLYANRIEALLPGPTAPLDATISNPGEVFAPFKAVQVELGGKARIGPVNASLAAFRTRLPSALAVPDPDAPGLSRFGLFGSQRNRGVELVVDGALAPNLRLIGGATWLDARMSRTPGGLNDGNRAPGVPRLSANAHVEWDTPFVPGLTLTGRLVATGRQQVDAANSLAIPGWTRIDLGARFVTLAGGRPLTLRAGIDNVTGRDYWASAFETFGTSLLQGQPRTVRLSASMDF